MTIQGQFVTMRLDRVMGCRAALSVAAPGHDAPVLLAAGRDLLDHLERRWSRFLPDSDISRINGAGGSPVVVDASTIKLLRGMAIGIEITGGAFDPTLLGAVAGLGYGPAWNRRRFCSRARPEPTGTRWLDHVVVDNASSTVTVPAGVGLDAGAIGKGLAADIVTAKLLAGGAHAVRITVGGDVRVSSPTVVGVANPQRRGVLVDRITVAAGGVATSGIGRSWTGPDGNIVHHVIDPATVRPLERDAADDVVQVTVAARSAATAEVLATACLVDPSDRRIGELDRLGAGVLLVSAGGDLVANSSWDSLRPRRGHELPVTS